MKPIGEGVVDRSALAGTILDANKAGKRLVFDVQRYLDRPVLTDEGAAIRKCRLEHRLRQGLKRDHAGRLIIPPMVRAADRLAAAMTNEDTRKVHREALNFFNVRCDEMSKEFDRIAGIRTASSAMLVGVGGYSADVFCGDNYAAGAIGFLKPWEVGLSSKVIRSLGLSKHEAILISRYPTTRVIPVEVVEVKDGSDDVVYLPIGTVSVQDEITSVSDLLDGDLDGDSYVIRAVKGEAAKAELREAFGDFWAGAKTQALDRTAYTWQDHEERIEDAEQIAREKFMQKAAIGSITLDWYCAFISVEHLQGKGVDTGLTMEDLRKLMTDSLENCFDLKHGNAADPMALHSLLTGLKTYVQVEESLVAQGLDTEAICLLAFLLRGQSVRKLAQDNLPFAVTQGCVDFNAVQRFINSAPSYRPLEFIASLMVAKTLKTPLACDLVFHTLKSARPLAVVYRDRLFSSLATAN